MNYYKLQLIFKDWGSGSRTKIIIVNALDRLDAISQGYDTYGVESVSIIKLLTNEEVKSILN